MDVAQDQPGTDKLQLFAFCGGKTKKVPGGGVNENGVGPIHDNTLEMTSTQANLIEATVLEKRKSAALSVTQRIELRLILLSSWRS